MLFSYYKSVNFPTIKIGNNEINDTYVTKFLGINLDKKNEFCKSYNWNVYKRCEVNYYFI